jgi:transcriptional regulator with XRE-family HTH domain
MADELSSGMDDTPSTMAGSLISRARRHAGISQRELARRSGVPGPVISAIERSRRQPSVPTMAKLLQGLDLEIRLDAVPERSRRTASPGSTETAGAAVPDGTVSPSGAAGISIRRVSASECLRARQVHSALDLANRIQRAKRREADRGVR